ncbi:MAG: hypothetical protein WAM53_13865 [Terrimicrobiaceae bacterium]
MNLPVAILAVLMSFFVVGCTVSPGPRRGYDAEVNVEEAGVRLLRNGMTVCLIRPQFSKVENWKLIDGNTEIVIKSRGGRGPAVVEGFDTTTGILKEKILASEIQNGKPEWAEGFED